MTAPDTLARVRAIITHLPARHRELGHLLAATYGHGYTERVSTSRVDPPSILDENAAVARAHIVDVLHRWAVETLHAYDLDPAPFGRHPAVMASVLLSAWSWIQVADGYLPIDVFCTEIIAVAEEADRILDPPAVMPITDRIHDHLIDGRDVARLAGVSNSRVRQWVADGSLTPRERGRNGRSLYNISDVKAYVATRHAAPGEALAAA